MKKSYRTGALLSLLILVGCNPFREVQIPVMTFNIRYDSLKDRAGDNAWEKRRPLLIACLDKYQPDILGTQEALESQSTAIHQAFPQWGFFGQGRYHNTVVPHRPWESLGGESCRIFFQESRFKLLDQGTFWHSDFPDSAGSATWGNDLPRIATWGKFRVKNSMKQFVVINTHFHWGEPYVDSTAILIMRKWREIAGDLPTILMGDFNQPPTSAAHDLFCGKSGPVELRGRFVDCWQALNKPEANAGTSHSFTGIGEKRIDWILVTPEFRVQSIEIIGDHSGDRYPSDHFPVIAEISF
jgi:endonuclease/exonuclease/phosphatase family metal-dependent hydrolase